MKRFTDTDIWDKQWFMDLTPAEKLAWFFIKDKCNNVGVWSPNFRLAEFIIGTQIDWNKFAGKCNGNIYIMDDGKWWVVDFCIFQHPDLVNNPQAEGGNKALKSYVRDLKSYGLYNLFLEIVESKSTGVEGASYGRPTVPKGAQGKAKQSKARQSKESSKADTTHHKTGKPMNSTTYEKIKEEYGKSVVDDYMERVADYENSNEKNKTYADHAATARNWLKKDGIKPREEQYNIHKTRFVNYSPDTTGIVQEASS